MAYRKDPVGQLIDIKPEEAKAKILAAFDEAKLVQTEAARKLGVAETTLIRWVKRLKLAPALKARRRAHARSAHADSRRRVGSRARVSP